MLALLVASAVLGFVVARAQGMAVLKRWLAANAASTVPEEGLTDGLLVLLGGVLLALPGVMSDALGLLLLVPPIRRHVAASGGGIFGRVIGGAVGDCFPARPCGGESA